MGALNSGPTHGAATITGNAPVKNAPPAPPPMPIVPFVPRYLFVALQDVGYAKD